MPRPRTPVVPALFVPLVAAALVGCAAVPPSPAAAPPAGSAPAAAPADAEGARIEARYAEEIAALAADPRVQRALRTIDELEPRTVRDLIELTEIPAPPFQEEARARAYAGMLREAGADSVWIDEVGNVIGVRRGTAGGNALVLSGHLDTVFPEGTDVTVRVRGDTLYAPGIGDDTRGLIAVLTVLRAMVAAELRTAADVWFVGTVGEEGLGDLRGVKHLFREGAAPVAAFISVDGSDPGRVVHQALGSRRYRIAFRGPGGHSWGAFGTANPAHALGRAIRLFDEAAAEYVASGPRTSYNVGVIGGGTSVNSVPFEAWMEVDMRSVSRERLLGIDSLLHQSVQQALAEQNQARRRGEPLTVEMELVGDRPSGAIPAENAFVQRALATAAHQGATPALTISSTDANVPISLGIPAVTIGGGGVGGNAHALDEWWLNENGAAGIQRALLLVLAEGGVE